MSIAPPEQLRTTLTSPPTVPGPDIPDRPDHGQFTDSCFQDGLADGERGIYDRYSFTSQAPTTFEHRCSSWLRFAMSKAIDKRHDDLHAARDISARAETELTRVQGRRRQAEQDLGEVEVRIDEAKAVLEDPRDALYEPLTEMLSSPEQVDKKSAKRLRKASRPAFAVARRTGSWLWRQPWYLNLLWLALVAGEIGLIFGITQRLGDDVTTGRLLALSVSALAVAIAELAVPPLLGSAAARARKVVSWIAVILYVVTILSLGWLRYLTSRPDVLELVEDAADSSVETIIFPWFGDALLYALWTALPLALTAVIALLHTHRDAERAKNQPAEGTDAPVTRPSEGPTPGGGPQDGVPDRDADLEHRRSQLISHLRGLRIQRRQIQEKVITLRAEETHADAVRENVKLNETAIDQRTRAHLQSQPQMVRDGFLRYLQGVEQAMADPTVTAYLHEAAATYMSRYEEMAEATMNEYLVYLDDHPLGSAARGNTAGEL